jgi:hypothetical protein
MKGSFVKIMRGCPQGKLRFDRIVIAIYFFTVLCPSTMRAESPEPWIQKLEELNIPETSKVLVVSISKQELIYYLDHQIQWEKPISTALKGIGQKRDSFQTPLGLHRIKQKLGKGLPQGAIFESRVYKGQIWVPLQDTAHHTNGPSGESEAETEPAISKLPELITSRILWLTGLEPGFNSGTDPSGALVDSYQRFIYIHGTNREEDIGKPTSYGCVRMFNRDVIELFDQVEEGDLVWIER